MQLHPFALALVPALLGACGSGASTSVDPAGTSPTAAPTHGSPPGAPTSPASPIGSPRPVVPIETEAGGAPYPIVLVHGMGGFDKLQQPVDLQYFNGVIADLGSIGETQVFATTAPPYDTSEDRAAAIAPQIAQILKQTGKAKVNLVGHSQGGMDARLLASPAGLALGAEIASVTTVATPHQGSLVADLVLGLLTDVPPSMVQSVTSAALSLLEKTAYQVQTDSAPAGAAARAVAGVHDVDVNPKYIDNPTIPYSSYGGRTNLETGVQDCASAVYPDDPTRVDDAQAEIQPLAQFLQGSADVTNDGLVTVASARWGTFLQCVPADHLKEVGQIAQAGADPVSGFDHLLFTATSWRASGRRGSDGRHTRSPRRPCQRHRPSVTLTARRPRDHLPPAARPGDARPPLLRRVRAVRGQWLCGHHGREHRLARRRREGHVLRALQDQGRRGRAAHREPDRRGQARARQGAGHGRRAGRGHGRDGAHAGQAGRVEQDAVARGAGSDA